MTVSLQGGLFIVLVHICKGGVQTNRHAPVIKHEGNDELKLVLLYFKRLKILAYRETSFIPSNAVILILVTGNPSLLKDLPQCVQPHFYLVLGTTEETKQCDFKFPCIKSL